MTPISLKITQVLFQRIFRLNSTMCKTNKITFKDSPFNLEKLKSCEQFFHFKFMPMAKPRLLLLSSSQVHGFEYLEYASDDINIFLNKNHVSRILFIPYALINHDAYLDKIRKVFKQWGYEVEGIHQVEAIHAVNHAEAIFIGGGNTFLLLKTLYEKKLIEPIRRRVLNDGVPYIGTSAGSNVAAPTIHNTNDMPIVFPPSFNALNFLPFNINPHYVDSDTNSTHKGETREERIMQYHQLPDDYEVYNVLALREGSTLFVDGQVGILKGISNARLFIRGKHPQEIEVGTDISHLFTDKLKPKLAKVYK